MAILNLTPPKLGVLGFFEGVDFTSQLRAREVENKLKLSQAEQISLESAYLAGSIDSRLSLTQSQADKAQTEADIFAETGLTSALLSNEALTIDNNTAEQELNILNQTGLRAASSLSAAREAQANAANASSSLNLERRRELKAQNDLKTSLRTQCNAGDQSACDRLNILEGVSNPAAKAPFTGGLFVSPDVAPTNTTGNTTGSNALDTVFPSLSTTPNG